MTVAIIHNDSNMYIHCLKNYTVFSINNYFNSTYINVSYLAKNSLPSYLIRLLKYYPR